MDQWCYVSDTTVDLCKQKQHHNCSTSNVQPFIKSNYFDYLRITLTTNVKLVIMKLVNTNTQQIRLHFTLLYFALLFTLLYFTLLYFTLLYFTLLYFTLLYFTLLYFTLLYFTLLYFRRTLLPSASSGYSP